MKQHHFSPEKLVYYLFVSIILMCLSTLDLRAESITLKRWQFDRALHALKTKDWKKFEHYSATLQDYPLYYYLRYRYLKPRLKQVPLSHIQTFLERYGNTYFGELLRRDELNQLAKKKNWNNFLSFYTPQKSTRLQCYYVYARLKTQQDIQAAIVDAKKLWLVGKPQPFKACNPVFKQLQQKGIIDNTLRWKRIGLAIKNGQLRFAKLLAKRLNPTDRVLVNLWQKMYQKPIKTLAKFKAADSAKVREIILHGIKRLAKKDFKRANRYWEAFQRRYTFSISDIGKMQRDLALASVKHDYSQALKWLSVVHKDYLNEKVSKTRIKLALKKQNWHALVDFLTELPDKERNILRWRYWLARALEKTGKNEQAQQLYEALAKQRDYYGFLAADRIDVSYQILHYPVTFSSYEKTELMKKVSMAAAYEFYRLSQFGGSKGKWIFNAQREWRYITKRLPKHQQAIAAKLASRWGWYDQAITTASKAGYYDDLEIRFPLAFYSYLSTGAKKQSIDLAWVYGIVRQESAFRSQARSHVGARGLMQLMPATARLVARKIGLKLKNSKDISKIDTNIRLGTAYLREMLDRFEGSYMLATAAYNAGPGRAKRWAARNSCVPGDLWVEMIPFNETRNYVRRVLFYTRIF